MNLPKKVVTPQKMTPGGETGVWSNTHGVVYNTWLGSHQTYVYEDYSKVCARGLMSGNLFHLNTMPLIEAMIRAAALAGWLSCSIIERTASFSGESNCYQICKNLTS